MRDIDESALRAASDERLFSDLVKNKKSFIIGCASKSARKFISESDDEWSVALIAFSDAVKTYSESRGGFLPYAEMIIRSRIIDYYRTERKHDAEFSVSPDVFNCETEENDENLSIKIAVAERLVTHERNSVKDEIEAITTVFKEYGFSFYDLADCSPKSQKTKNACRQAVLYILENENIIKEIKTSRQLPIKKILNDTKLPRKLIERHRRYIIAAAEILSGKYPCLAEYVSFIRKKFKV